MQDNTELEKHRKRINRIKKWIIVILILLFLIPSILCIYLITRINRLENQVIELLNIEYGDGTYGNDSLHVKGKYAYAADKGIAPEEDAADEGTLSEEKAIKDKGTALENEDIADEGIVPGTELVADKGNKPGNEAISDIGTAPGKTASHGEKPHSENLTIADEMAEQENSDAILPASLKYTGKKVYLTFDDGPSIYTDDILDILKEYDVKATFFVVGKTDKTSKELYQRIVEEGHTLGMHSYSHIYDNIYNSLEDFEKDFTKLWKLLYDTTGYKPAIFRFPGGSSNKVNDHGMDEFIEFLNEKSIVYFDWNVVNGDATGVKYTKEQLTDNVLNDISVKKTSIVLMHDSETKKTTVDSLPDILDELIIQGAEILPLDEDVPPIQQIKLNETE